MTVEAMNYDEAREIAWKIAYRELGAPYQGPDDRAGKIS